MEQRRYGRYVDAMDEYLGRLELVRRPMPTDDTSLFRAVSEQIYQTQRLHREIEQLCRRHIDDNRPPNHLPATHAAIVALSSLFKRDIVIYRELGRAPYNANGNRYPQKVFLCESFGSHFDSVYHKAAQEKLGLCQSLVYELVYCDVLGMDRTVVATALQRLRAVRPPGGYPYGRRRFSDNDRNSDNHQHSPNNGYNRRIASTNGDWGLRPPLPYKVLKALDPALYRNIEYDSWLDERKEFYLQGGRRDDHVPFPPGRECLVKFGPSSLYCGIVQQILPDREHAVVFIRESGEMREVPMWCLSAVPPAQRLRDDNGNLRRPELARRHTSSFSNARTTTTTAVQSFSPRNQRPFTTTTNSRRQRSRNISEPSTFSKTHEQRPENASGMELAKSDYVANSTANRHSPTATKCHSASSCSLLSPPLVETKLAQSTVGSSLYYYPLILLIHFVYFL